VPASSYVVPASFLVAGIAVWARHAIRERYGVWRSRGGPKDLPYVPTRVWIDGRYGDPNADPSRYGQAAEFIAGPPMFDPGPPPGSHRDQG
jgi:hypothetical protein